MALVKRKAYPHPISTAKNSYTLLDDVKKVVLEEPRRVWMDNWKANIDYVCKMTGAKKGPACGTIGCISGWVTFLKPDANQSAMSGENVLVPNDGSDERRNLRDVLHTDLFYDTEVDAKYGTKKYATIVAKRITAFQKKWATELKAVTID